MDTHFNIFPIKRVNFINKIGTSNAVTDWARFEFYHKLATVL